MKKIILLIATLYGFSQLNAQDTILDTFVTWATPATNFVKNWAPLAISGCLAWKCWKLNNKVDELNSKVAIHASKSMNALANDPLMAKVDTIQEKVAENKTQIQLNSDAVTQLHLNRSIDKNEWKEQHTVLEKKIEDLQISDENRILRISDIELIVKELKAKQFRQEEINCLWETQNKSNFSTIAEIQCLLKKTREDFKKNQIDLKNQLDSQQKATATLTKHVKNEQKRIENQQFKASCLIFDLIMGLKNTTKRLNSLERSSNHTTSLFLGNLQELQRAHKDQLEYNNELKNKILPQALDQLQSKWEKSSQAIIEDAIKKAYKPTFDTLMNTRFAIRDEQDAWKSKTIEKMGADIESGQKKQRILQTQVQNILSKLDKIQPKQQ